MSGIIMKKFLILVLSLLLVLTALTPVLAEDSALRTVVDSVADVLLDMDNVTVSGTAEFSLDGDWFKSVNTVYSQCGYRSLWKLDLLSPLPDGGKKASGWTIHADEEKLHVIEVIFPGTYITGTGASQNSILRPSVSLNVVADIVRGMADYADLILGRDAVTVGKDGGSVSDVHIVLDENKPAIVDTALNLAARYAADRYFSMDYDRQNPRYMTNMEYYFTTTQAILNSTRSYSLKSADITVKFGPGTLLSSISGNIAVNLNTAHDGVRLLEFSFDFEISDIGKTVVERFKAADYGVKLRENFFDFTQPANVMSIPEGSVIPAHDDRDFPEDIEAWEISLWDKAGYDGEKVFQYNDGLCTCTFAEDGTLLEMQDAAVPWLSMYVDGSQIEWFDEKPVTADEKTTKQLLDFLAYANPGMEKNFASFNLAWRVRYDGRSYVQYEGVAKDGGEETVIFVLNETADFLIQYFSCISNG